MAIPVYEKLYKSILLVLSDGKVHNSRETIARCATDFQLSSEEQSAMLQSGTQTVLANRVAWARTYLKKAGLITSPSRGHYQITQIGLQALNAPVVSIDNAYLKQFPGFQDFIKKTGSDMNSESMSEKSDNATTEDVQTPLEMMESAHKGITAQLADELMTNIMDQKPAFFEKLVIDLLKKMGYGGKLASSGEVTGRTGDEGIDGIIRQDALGFDKIYVQAKRWAADHSVGEPDIQQFAGALMGKGATKGLFITTSHFSKQAVNYVDRHMTARIVLIDGDALTQLMIRYGLGVSTVKTFDIKRIDSDYFAEETE